jgi:hypothetical protein
MTQIVGDSLEAGREAARRREWDRAYELLKAAEAELDLGADDVQLLAHAALWNGRMDEQLTLLERAYAAHRDEGNKVKAAYAATMLAHDYKNALQPSVANGWLGRAKRLLDDEPEAPEHGYYANTTSTRRSPSGSKPRSWGGASAIATSRFAASSARAAPSSKRVRSLRGRCSSTRRAPPHSAAS